MAQTGRSATAIAELPHLVRLKLQPVCESKHGGVGPFALFELRGNGIEDSSKNEGVRAGMFCQQAKESVVVPDAVSGRAQLLQGYGRGVGIDGQSLPDEGVRTLRETVQHSAISLGMRQCEVVGGHGHEGDLSGASKPSSCHCTLLYLPRPSFTGQLLARHSLTADDKDPQRTGTPSESMSTYNTPERRMLVKICQVLWRQSVLLTRDSRTIQVASPILFALGGLNAWVGQAASDYLAVSAGLCICFCAADLL